MKPRRAGAVVDPLVAALVACGDEGGNDAADSITLVTYDSFPTADSVAQRRARRVHRGDRRRGRARRRR